MPVGLVKESSDTIEGLVSAWPGPFFSVESGLTAAAMFGDMDFLLPKIDKQLKFESVTMRSMF